MYQAPAKARRGAANHCGGNKHKDWAILRHSPKPKGMGRSQRLPRSTPSGWWYSLLRTESVRYTSDYAKTGVLYPMPRTISKYGRPLPYFMKYASDYYGKLKLAKTRSNMNRLCWELEHWQRDIHWKRTDKDFDYSLMIDCSVEMDDDTYRAVESVYRSFGKDMKQLVLKIRGVDEDERRRAYALLYEQYRNKVLAACGGDIKLAANTTVILSREHKSWNQKFPWIVAGPGIVQNIKLVPASMPAKDETGELEYLGKNYTWAQPRQGGS